MTAPRLDTSRPCRLRGVAFVVPGFDALTGPTRGARRLAESLAGQGVPVTFVTTATAGVDAPRTEVRGIVQVYRVPARSIGDGRTSRDLLELFALGLLAGRRERVEAVYGAHPHGGAAAVRVAQALGAPAVIELAAPIGAHAERERLRDARVLVAPTRTIALEAERTLGLPRDRVVRSARGVGLDAFAPRPAPAGRRTVLVGAASTPTREAALLAALGPVVAGRGLTLVRRDESPGPELQRDLAAWVLPAATDTPEDALLEALACGVPVIAVASPGVDEAVREGEGVRVDGDDPSALAAALARVLDDAQLAARLGAAARARAEDAFDLEQVAARHALLFERLKTERNGAQLDGAALARATFATLVRTGRDATRSTVGALRDIFGA